MIIQCDKCQTKFRLDDSKIKGAGVKVRCTKCQNVFIVPSPVEEAAVEEAVVQPPVGQKATEQRPASRQSGKENLSFKFNAPPKGPAPEEEGEEKGPGAPSADIGGEAGGEGFDFSFKGPGGEEGAAESAPEVGKEGAEVPSGSFDSGGLGGFDLGIGAGRAEEEPAAGDTGKAAEAEPTTSGRKEPPAIEAHEKNVSAPSPEAGYGEAPMGVEPSLDEEVSSGDFSEVLKESVERGGERPPHAEEVYYDEKMEESAPAPSAQSKALIVLAVAVLVIIIGLGVMYFRGFTLHRGTAPKTVDIEGVKGYYVENNNAGKVFVIEALIKNVSEAPQEVKSIKGVLYDASGTKLSEHMAAPGRVLSADDLKTLSREDLMKQFKDPSGGTIPPKGTIPVMVLFIEAPPGMAEYGVDIVR